MSPHQNRTVIVTGASRGLGQAIAVAFGAQGAFVGVHYRARAHGAEETLARIREVGGDGCALSFDVRDLAGVEAGVAQLLERRGELDVLVNNAGLASDAPLPFLEARDWKEVVDTNLTGAFHCTRAVLDPMMAQARGAIVNVGSVAGLRASPGQANYAAAKGGLLALTRTMAAELAPRGIRVNAVVPGLLSVGLAARLDRSIAERMRERIPLGRFGDAKEVAEVVLFVASPLASYLTGQAIVVDGGLTL